MKKRSGRPKILTQRASRRLRLVTRKNRKQSLRRISGEFNMGLDVKASSWTIRRELQRIGINSRVARRKPKLTKKHKRARLDWCRKHVATDWSKVVFSDESSIELTPGKVERVWRSVGEEYIDDCITPTQQAGGGKVMVWGCMTADGVGQLKIIEGKLNSDGYISVLGECFLPDFGETEDEWILQDDNSSVHRARKVTEWKEENNVQTLEWPAMSPDLNPIENLWDHLDKAVRKLQYPPRSIGQLAAVLLLEWENISEDLCDNLVSSIPERIQETIHAKGGHTKY